MLSQGPLNLSEKPWEASLLKGRSPLCSLLPSRRAQWAGGGLQIFIAESDWLIVQLPVWWMCRSAAVAVFSFVKSQLRLVLLAPHKTWPRLLSPWEDMAYRSSQGLHSKADFSQARLSVMPEPKHRSPNHPSRSTSYTFCLSVLLFLLHFTTQQNGSSDSWRTWPQLPQSWPGKHTNKEGSLLSQSPKTSLISSAPDKLSWNLLDGE